MLTVFSQAWQSWKSAKGIAFLAIVAFAVGLGAITAIYTIIDAVMLSRLPYAEGKRFVVLYSAHFSEPDLRGSSELADLIEYERRTASFDVFGAFRMDSSALIARGEPQRISSAAVMPSLVQNLGVSPSIGRWFSSTDEVVLSDVLWRRL